MIHALATLASRAAVDPQRALLEVTQLVLRGFGSEQGVVLEFVGSDSRPRAHRLLSAGSVRVSDGFLRAGEEVSFTAPSMVDSKMVPVAEVSSLGPDWPEFFDGDVLYVPLLGAPLGFFLGPDRRILKENSAPQATGCLLLGLPGSEKSWQCPEWLVAAGVLGGHCIDLGSAEQARKRLAHFSLKKVRNDAEGGATSEQMGRSVLEALRRAVPFRSGVFYTLDPSNQGNRCMTYSASFREGSTHLFKSSWAREDLGITWKAAMLNRVLGGGQGDVPVEARGTNDQAWEAVLGEGRAHEAWALVPIASPAGEALGVAHLEGLNEGTGLRRSDSHLLFLVAGILGTSLKQWRASVKQRASQVASPGDIEGFKTLLGRRDSGEPVQRRFEAFVSFLLQAIPGVELRELTGRGIPECDGAFEFQGVGGFAVEVKLPEARETSLGIDAVRQFRGVMTAWASDESSLKDLPLRCGLLTVAGRFGSRTAAAEVSSERIILLDEPRLERLCCLSPSGRSAVLRAWLEGKSVGLQLANFDALDASRVPDSGRIRYH